MKAPGMVMGESATNARLLSIHGKEESSETNLGYGLRRSGCPPSAWEFAVAHAASRIGAQACQFYTRRTLHSLAVRVSSEA